jgi:hypothetical protein
VLVKWMAAVSVSASLKREASLVKMMVKMSKLARLPVPAVVERCTHR